MTSNFKGTGVALVTPFRNGAVDYPALETLINHDIQGGVEFLVSLGTTGENVTLDKQEKRKVLEFTAKVVNERVPLVAGFGGNDTRKLLQEVTDFDFAGYQGILSASPAYNRPNQEGIYQHYMKLAEIAPRPIIIYNVPGRTSSNISAETTLRLANASEQFTAVKEASGDLAQVMQIVKNKPENFTVLSGDDNLTLPMMSFGAEGLISVVSNAFPEDYSTMVRLALDNRFEEARKIHLAYIDLVNLLFVEGNPAGIKAALEMHGICGKEVRLPLVSLTDASYLKLKDQVEQVKNKLQEA